MLLRALCTHGDSVVCEQQPGDAGSHLVSTVPLAAPSLVPNLISWRSVQSRAVQAWSPGATGQATSGGAPARSGSALRCSHTARWPKDTRLRRIPVGTWRRSHPRAHPWTARGISRSLKVCVFRRPQHTRAGPFSTVTESGSHLNGSANARP